MILVTGAAGKTGRAVIEALAAKGRAIRALVHRPEQRCMVEALGAQDVLAGDMRNAETMRRASRGVVAIYHICPNMHPDEEKIGQTVIAAARQSGVEQMVYHSVLHPQTELMPHHWKKLRVEEQLFESGLNVAILQPTAYMQNILTQWDRIAGEGIYAVPYAIETRLSLVDLVDVAEVAALVLTEPSHTGGTYELVGTEGLSQAEIAEELSEQLGRRVRAHVVPRDAWAQQARDAGLGPYQVQTLLQMFRYYEEYGLVGNPRVLHWLLERPPTPLAATIARAATSRSDQPGG
jgi:NAD(P)H dehydrogenase (quinone)